MFYCFLPNTIHPCKLAKWRKLYLKMPQFQSPITPEGMGRRVRRKIEQKCDIGKCWGLTSGISGSSPGEKIPLRRKVKPQRKRKGYKSHTGTKVWQEQRKILICLSQIWSQTGYLWTQTRQYRQEEKLRTEENNYSDSKKLSTKHSQQVASQNCLQSLIFLSFFSISIFLKKSYW